MQSAYHANRLHDLFIMLIQLAFLAKKIALSDAVRFGYWSGAICRHF